MHSCNHQSRTKLKFWFSRSSWDGPSRPHTSSATAIVLAFTLLATLNLYDSFKLQGLYMNLRGCILALCDLVFKPYVHEITGYLCFGAFYLPPALFVRFVWVVVREFKCLFLRLYNAPPCKRTELYLFTRLQTVLSCVGFTALIFLSGCQVGIATLHDSPVEGRELEWSKQFMAGGVHLVFCFHPL